MIIRIFRYFNIIRHAMVSKQIITASISKKKKKLFRMWIMKQDGAKSKNTQKGYGKTSQSHWSLQGFICTCLKQEVKPYMNKILCWYSGDSDLCWWGGVSIHQSIFYNSISQPFLSHSTFWKLKKKNCGTLQKY